MKVIHRLDLEEDKVEGICVQVKAGSKDTLLGIIYRPPNQNSEFFAVFPKLLEKAWMKFSNIVLLGGFNIAIYYRTKPAKYPTRGTR